MPVLSCTATRYEVDDPGIESGRSQWPSGLRRVCAATSLLGFRVRILPGTWMCVLCVMYSKDKRQSQENQYEEVQIKYTKQKKSR